MKRLALVFAGALALALPAAAAEPPTIAADPSILGTGTPVVLSGTAPGAEQGETVQIEAKECRGTFFRVFAAATTRGGGSWRHEGFVNVNTTFRARWKTTVSTTVEVKQRTFVSLVRRSRTVVVATVVTPFQKMIGRIVRLERHTPSGWVLVRRAKLKKLAGPATEARFLVTTKRLQLRATVDQANARPCYAAGVSPIIRS